MKTQSASSNIDAAIVGRSTRLRRLTHSMLSVGTITAAVSLSAIPAFGALHSARPTTTHRAFTTVYESHGVAARNVCSYAVGAGVAHCNASRRIDSRAQLARPLQHAVASPNVLGNGGAYDPSYLQSAYNIASLAAARSGGAGQIVGIVDAYDDPSLANDLAYYRNYFNLPACPVGTVAHSNSSCVFQKVNEAGATSPLPSANSSWGVETSLDIEMVSAICPKCQILLVEGTTASINDLGSAVNTAVSMGVNVVSNSYGAMEYFNEDNDSSFYYNHPGVPIVVSSGDSGYGVEFPAASPLVTAVGGTTLNQLSNTGTRNATESVWSGAGAGCSSFEAKPSWQHDTGCANRTVADVAAVANPSTGVWVYDTYGNSGFAIYGGTSVAAPIISSIYALATNTPSTTTPASYLYASASSLTPVTSGSDGSCGTYLCDATHSLNGYNGPTGLGTPGASPNSLGAFTPSSSSPSVPSAPNLSTATAANGQVSLSWSAPSSNGGSAITGYNVFVGTSPGAESATPVNSSLVSSTTYTISPLTNGSTYYFDVKAVNAVGASSASNELSATPVAPPTVPGSPSLTSAVAASGQVSLTWSAPTSSGGSAITGYNVYVGTSPGAESATRVNSSLVPSTTYSVGSLTNGTTYYFDVSAVNAVGSSSASNELSATPAAAVSVPGAPSLTSAIATSGQVSLAWSAPSSNGGSAITGYNVYMGTSPGAESATPINTSLVTSTTYSVGSLTNGTTYYIVIRAVNSVGSSSASNELSATPAAVITVPSAPFLNSATGSNGAVTLSWSPPSNTGGSLSGYNVFVGTSSGHELATAVNTSLVTSTTYSVGSLTNGRTYYFVVRAVNSAGSSVASNQLSAKPATFPAAPTSLTAKSDRKTGVDLSWHAPASNGGSSVTSYAVFRSTTSGTEIAVATMSCTSSICSFTDTTTTRGVTYFYEVAAINVIGTGPSSNETFAIAR